MLILSILHIITIGVRSNPMFMEWNVKMCGIIIYQVRMPASRLFINYFARAFLSVLHIEIHFHSFPKKISCEEFLKYNPEIITPMWLHIVEIIHKTFTL